MAFCTFNTAESLRLETRFCCEQFAWGVIVIIFRVAILGYSFIILSRVLLTQCCCLIEEM